MRAQGIIPKIQSHGNFLPLGAGSVWPKMVKFEVCRSYLLFQWQRPIDSDSLCLIYGWTGEKYFFSKWIRSPSVKVMVPMELCDHSSNLASIFARFTPKFNIAFVCSCADQEISVGGIPNSKEVCICKVHNLIATFSLLEHCGKVQKYICKVRQVYFQRPKLHFESTKVYVQSTKVYFQSTKLYFQFTKAYFQSTKAYVQSTKVYCQSTKAYFQSILSTYKSALSNCKKILSAYKSILSTKVEKYTCKAQQIYFQRTNAYFQSTKVHFQSTRVYFRFEVQSNCRKPWPGTFLIPRGTRFPETVPSNPREQNLTPRNPSNTETFETSFTQPSEPEPWNRKTCRNPSKAGSGSQNWFPEPVPGTGSRNPVPSRNRPSSPTPKSILCKDPIAFCCWGKKSMCIHTYMYMYMYMYMYIYILCVWNLYCLYSFYMKFIEVSYRANKHDESPMPAGDFRCLASSKLLRDCGVLIWAPPEVIIPFSEKKKKNEKSRKQSTFLPMKHIFQWIDMVGWHKNHPNKPLIRAWFWSLHHGIQDLWRRCIKTIKNHQADTIQMSCLQMADIIYLKDCLKMN